MDPNATLVLMHQHLDAGEHEEAAALFVALDAWLRKGGFLPDAWLPAWAASRRLSYEDGVKEGRREVEAEIRHAVTDGRNELRAAMVEAAFLAATAAAYERGADAGRGY